MARKPISRKKPKHINTFKIYFYGAIMYTFKTFTLESARTGKDPEAKEKAHQAHFQTEIDRVKKETGKDHVVIHHNGTKHHITHIEKVNGTPKADFKLHDKNGKHVYLSHKDYDSSKGGALEKHYQQLGGVSHIINHSSVKKLAAHIKKHHGGTVTGSGHGTIATKLDHKNPDHQKVMQRAIFGNNHGSGKHDKNNIHSIIQGKMNLKKRSDGSHEITANHIHHHNEPVKSDGMVYATADRKRHDGKQHGLHNTRLRIGFLNARGKKKMVD